MELERRRKEVGFKGSKELHGFKGFKGFRALRVCGLGFKVLGFSLWV